jgi:cytidylate kinase
MLGAWRRRVYLLGMVTISRQAGAGGEEIARILARESGWRLLDNELVEELLANHGLPHVKSEPFDERRPDLWHRFSAEKDRYLHSLKLVSFEFARQGSCVILGRAGQVLFAGVPGVVRVRVIAPLQDRILRVREKSGGDEPQARNAVQRADNDRSGFHRFLFNVDWESPALYDLIINTHVISAQTAAALILQNPETRKETARRLEELYLVQKAIVAILFEQKLPIHCLNIEVHNGTMTLQGTAQDRSSIARCEEVAAAVCASKKIHNEISFSPRFVEYLAGIR